MKILIHGINYFPELTGIGKYTGEMGEWLALRGHEVRVVTAPPYYPEWKVGKGYSNRWRREEIQGCMAQDSAPPLEACVLNPVIVYRCPLWVPCRPSGLKRLIHLASFFLSSLPVMLRQAFWKPDIVFTVEPSFFCCFNALLVAGISGSRSWLHIQDFEVDAGFDLGILPSSIWARRVIFGFEGFVMRRFDRVSTISKRMLEKLDEKHVDLERRIFFPNWVDAEAIRPLEKSDFRQEIGLPENAVVCLYSGNMGEKQGLEILIDAARLISEASGKGRGARGESHAELSGQPEIVFVLCGSGGARKRLEALAENIANILWLPLQPDDKLNDLLNMADIHLLPQRGDVADLVMPSKLTGMLASGKPVVATAKEGTGVAEAVSGHGIVVEPGNPEALAKAIADLSVNSDLRLELGKAGRVYAVEHLGKDAILSGIESAMLDALP